MILVLGGVAYTNKNQLLLAMIKYKSATEHDVGPPREIAWNQGPVQAEARVQTPHIDQLAAQGAVFTQSYSGAGTCAPSRAMMMTGRYPTRTGFEFTPIPSGMGGMVSKLSASMDTGLPPGLYDAALDESKPPYETQG